MGQKTHPTGFRLGIIKTWSSRWYQDKNYAKWLHEDLRLKGFIKKKLNFAGISYIEIERAANKCKINIHTARPGPSTCRNVGDGLSRSRRHATRRSRAGCGNRLK